MKLDNIHDARDLKDMEVARILALKADLLKWKKRKGQLIKQCSWKKILTDKDNNTKFFHSKKGNEIARIKIGGVVLEKG